MAVPGRAEVPAVQRYGATGPRLGVEHSNNTMCALALQRTRCPWPSEAEDGLIDGLLCGMGLEDAGHDGTRGCVALAVSPA